MDKKPSVSRAAVRDFLDMRAKHYRERVKDAVTMQGKMEHLYPEKEAEIQKCEHRANHYAEFMELTLAAIYYIDHVESEDQLF